MKKTKIVTILGARPQFVKSAVLSRVILEKQEIEEVIVHTGQHYDNNMSGVFFEQMSIPHPKYFLDVNGLSHGAMTGQMLEKIEAVLLKEKPSAVVVYGDTNSTLSGALAAKKLNLKLVHIESGLRSYNMTMPEEINRILTDRISDLLLCPTQYAVDTLKQEGFNNFKCKIANTGDIMKEAVLYYTKISQEKSEVYNTLNLQSNNFVLVTIHRQENTDDKKRLVDIFKALDTIHKQMPVVLPLHPRTKKYLDKYSIKTSIKLIEPVGYFDMLELLKNCNLVVTDSGGLQKEAFFNQKPLLIVRDETEWVELVKHDYAKIVGAKCQNILKAFESYQNVKPIYNQTFYGVDIAKTIYEEIKQLIF